MQGSPNNHDRNGSNEHLALDAESLEAGIRQFAEDGQLAQVARDAAARHRAKGYPITFKRGNQVVRQHADGREEILATVAPINYRLPDDVERIGNP